MNIYDEQLKQNASDIHMVLCVNMMLKHDFQKALSLNYYLKKKYRFLALNFVFPKISSYNRRNLHPRGMNEDIRDVSIYLL